MARKQGHNDKRNVQIQALYRYLSSTGFFSSRFLQQVISANFFIWTPTAQWQILRQEEEIDITDVEYADTCMLYRLCFAPDHSPRPFTPEMFGLISNTQTKTEDGTL